MDFPPILPLGEKRDHPLGCSLGDWVSESDVPSWSGLLTNQTVLIGTAAPDKRMEFARFFHVTPSRDENVWKRVR